MVFLCMLSSRPGLAAVAAQFGPSEPKVVDEHQRPKEFCQIPVETGGQLRFRFATVVVRHERRLVLRHFHAVEPDNTVVFPREYTRNGVAYNYTCL